MSVTFHFNARCANLAIGGEHASIQVFGPDGKSVCTVSVKELSLDGRPVSVRVLSELLKSTSRLTEAAREGS